MARTSKRFNAIAAPREKDEQPILSVWRAGIYARLSSDRDLRKGESINSQLLIMRKFLSGRAEFVEILEYIDRGFSGTNFRRPAFEQMMKDIRNGRINCIVVKDMSRLGRDYLETSNYVETIFPFLGVRFISVNDHFDTSRKNSGNKELEIVLKNLVNDLYARDISKRIVTTRRQEQQSGKFMGRYAPYGYRIDNEDPLRRLVIDEPAAEVVRDIFRMVLDGMKLREISLTLQKRGLSIPGQYTQTGHLYYEPGDEVRKWYVGTLSNILHGQVYIGNMVQGKRRERLYKGEARHATDPDEWLIVENTHEAIIPRETFDRVQQVLARRTADMTFSSDRTADIPVKKNRFSNLLFCGICGQKLTFSSYVPETGPRERRYYFLCANNYDINIEGHNGIHIIEPVLEEVLRERIKCLLVSIKQRNGGMKQVFEKRWTSGSEAGKKAIRKTEKQLSDLDLASAGDYEAYVLGDLSKDEFLVARTASEEKRAKLEEELKRLREKSDRFEQRVREMREWLMGLRRASEGELDEELIRLLIARIELFPEHELRIVWRFTEDDLAGDEKEES